MTRPGERFLVFGQPFISEEAVDAVAETLRSRWIGSGPKVEALEAAICERVGCRFAIAVTSCTVGLEVALRACGIQPGDEVITSGVTFVATANAIVHAGGVPVLVDVDPVTRTLDPIAVEKALTARTRALVPVHLSGLPCDMTELQAIAREHDLRIVEDAAHALGAAVDDRPVGSISDMSVFSFGPPKHVTTGEGGMITTNDADLARTAATFCRQGLPSSAWTRLAEGNLGVDLAVTAGHNYRMTDIAAAIGLVGIRQFDADSRRRAEIWERFNQAFAGLPLELPPEAPEGCTHGRQLYSPLVDVERLGQSRDWMRARLHDGGIGTGVHYVALNRHPYLQELLGIGDGDLPHAERIGDRTFSVPFSAHLTDDDVEHVITAVRQACAS